VLAGTRGWLGSVLYGCAHSDSLACGLAVVTVNCGAGASGRYQDIGHINRLFGALGLKSVADLSK